MEKFDVLFRFQGIIKEYIAFLNLFDEEAWKYQKEKYLFIIRFQFQNQIH